MVSWRSLDSDMSIARSTKCWSLTPIVYEKLIGMTNPLSLQGQQTRSRKSTSCQRGRTSVLDPTA